MRGALGAPKEQCHGALIHAPAGPWFSRDLDVFSTTRVAAMGSPSIQDGNQQLPSQESSTTELSLLFAFECELPILITAILIKVPETDTDTQ